MTKRPLIIQLILLAIAVLLFIVVVIFHLFVPRLSVRPPDFVETFELEGEGEPAPTEGVTPPPARQAMEESTVAPGVETAYSPRRAGSATRTGRSGATGRKGTGGRTTARGKSTPVPSSPGRTSSRGGARGQAEGEGGGAGPAMAPREESAYD